MGMDPAEWWRSRRGPSVGCGDGWSGGGGAYRAWVASKPGREWPPNPRSARRMPGAVRRGRQFGFFAEVVLSAIPGGWLIKRLLWRKRLGVSLGIAAAGLLAILSAAPLAWAGSPYPCEAAEAALIDERLGPGSGFEAARRRVANWVGPDGKLFSRGRVARQIVVEEHPGWPPAAACTALFWRVRATSASVDGIMISLLRGAAPRR